MSARGDLMRAASVRLAGVGGVVMVILVMALDGRQGEHQGEGAEDQRLHEREHDLQAVEGDGQDRDEERRDDAQRDLATVDVAEEPHRERERLDELEEQLHEADEEGDIPAGEVKLSKRQKQLILMLDRGLSNRDIAAELNISEHTVKVHLWRLFRRIGVKSRTQTLHYARTHGLLMS